jgi:hypothetical protein
LALYDGVNGASEVAPVLMPLREGPVTRPRELVHASSASIDFRPTAREEASLFKPMQRRVERTFREVERTVTAGTQRLCDRVAVRRARLHGSEQQKIKVALQRFSVHSS